jgi:hypothetical protein
VSLTLPVTATAGGTVEDTVFLTFPDSPLNLPAGQVAVLLAGSWSDVSVSTPSPSGGLSKTVTGTFPVGAADRTAAMRVTVTR